MTSCHRRRRLREPARVVEYRSLRFGCEQRVVLVLAVDVDETLADISQASRRHQTVVQVGALATTGGENAADGDLVGVAGIVIARLFRVRAIRGRERSRHRRPGEQRFDLGLGRAGAQQIGGTAITEHQAERSHEDRLPRTGLAGDDVEARLERDLHVLDDGEIANAEVGEHAAEVVRLRRGA